MKKIILCVVILLTVLCGVARADVRSPEFERHLTSLGNLPQETRLERCRGMVGLPSKYGWNLREWNAMQCSVILPSQELLQACEKLEFRCEAPAPASRCPLECNAAFFEKRQKQIKEYQAKTQREHLALIGLSVFFICGVALWLLIRNRKK